MKTHVSTRVVVLVNSLSSTCMSGAARVKGWTVLISLSLHKHIFPGVGVWVCLAGRGMPSACLSAAPCRLGHSPAASLRWGFRAHRDPPRRITRGHWHARKLRPCRRFVEALTRCCRVSLPSFSYTRPLQLVPVWRQGRLTPELVWVVIVHFVEQGFSLPVKVGVRHSRSRASLPVSLLLGPRGHAGRK